MAKILVGGSQMNDKIKEQILTIRETGITNMFDKTKAPTVKVDAFA